MDGIGRGWVGHCFEIKVSFFNFMNTLMASANNKGTDQKKKKKALTLYYHSLAPNLPNPKSPGA
jgi:hypothetical protein